MTSTSTALKEIYHAAWPVIEQGLEVTEHCAAFRQAATAKGLDWSQIKALLRAQILDTRDETGQGRRVLKAVLKAENASAYAEVLGLMNMNEKNSVCLAEASASHPLSGAAGRAAAEFEAGPPAVTVPEVPPPAEAGPAAEQAVEAPQASPVPSEDFDMGGIPAFMDRRGRGPVERVLP